MVLQPNPMFVITFFMGMHFLLFTFTFVDFVFLYSLCVVWGLYGVVVHLHLRGLVVHCPYFIMLRSLLCALCIPLSLLCLLGSVRFLYHRLDRSCVVSLGPGMLAGSVVVTVFVSSSEHVVFCSPLLCCTVFAYFLVVCTLY